MNSNRTIIFGMLNIFCCGVIGAMSADRTFFSILNNTTKDFNLEISFGAPATTAKPNTTAIFPDVAISELYQDKLLFDFPAGTGIDIQKNQFRRYPTYLRLLSPNQSYQSESSQKTQSVFQTSDRSIRKEVALGIDNVNNKTGVVFNTDPQGVISFKFFDVRPDTKVIRPSYIRIRRPSSYRLSL